MARLKKSQFKFRATEKVGAEGAEQDREFLADCFYDRGDLQTLRDTEHSACLVVGRTGSGKTAIFERLAAEEEHVLNLNPDNLSLHYLSDASILRRLESLGVNLSLFYKLLWKHIFAVELIKAKYGMRTESETANFLTRFFEWIGGDRAKKQAIDYLLTWGKSFWHDTEYRVKEVTTKLENEIKANLGAKLGSVFDASLSGSEKVTAEEKAELVSHAQQVVKAIQVRELTTVIKTLEEHVFDVPLPRFYVTIDRLDENWVEDHLRYRLIKALVETAKELNHLLGSVKILIAIRLDLLDRVIQETREQGFQEEKYNPLMLNLRWTKEELIGMLDRRVEKLVRRQYTQQPVSHRDVMPVRVQGHSLEDYLIERTLHRPRDLIVFFNYCIEQAAGTPEITPQMLIAAEGVYSQKRLTSLRDEWDVDFPELVELAALLKKRPAKFRVGVIPEEDVVALCLEVTVAKDNVGRRTGRVTEWATEVSDEQMKPSDFLLRLMSVYYKVGLVGVKLETFESVRWSHLNESNVTPEQIREDTHVSVCPIFYRALGVNPSAT